MHIRPAHTEDTQPLSALLNEIITEGGKTAIDTPLTGSEFSEWFLTGAHCITCVVAADTQEKPLGFQSPERFHRDLPVGRADIATYVSKGARGTGIGRALATATMRLADEADLNSIRAVIQHRNDNAIQYYRSLGFQDDLSGTTKGAIELLFTFGVVLRLEDRYQRSEDTACALNFREHQTNLVRRVPPLIAAPLPRSDGECDGIPALSRHHTRALRTKNTHIRW